MRSLGRRELVITGILLLAALVAVGLRVIHHETEYRALEPLRHAVSLAKSGETVEALPVLMEFARKGDAPTMLVLAEIHAYGIDLPYDERHAAVWARAASSTGKLNTDGSFEYGVARAYLSGERGTVDRDRALAWCIRAAEAGNRDAQKALASGTEFSPVDPATSAYWRSFLASMGD
jgi:TPR repeat protein